MGSQALSPARGQARSSPSSVITVRVKEEHLDMASPNKAPSPQLPVPIENIKQETDD